MKETKKKIKKKIIEYPLLFSLILLVLFCIGAAITRAIELSEIPASFLGAALGAVITVLVTYLLLIGQTKAEETQERNAKIFELKKNAFTKYMDNVWKVLANKKIDDKKFEGLCSGFYEEIAMYLDETSSRKFVQCLIKIGESIRIDENYSKTKENIFAIINILVKDIMHDPNVDDDHEYVSLDNYNLLEEELFPGLFKKAIAEEIFEVLKSKNCFSRWEYKDVYYAGYEFLCYYFDTKETTGYSECAKIIIGPLAKRSNKWPNWDSQIDLYIDNDIENWPKQNKKMPSLYHYKEDEEGWYRRTIGFKEEIRDIFKPMDNGKEEIDEEEINNDTKETYKIDFADKAGIKKYLENYRNVAKALAARVEKFMDRARIIEKDLRGRDTGTELSIIEFMQKNGLIK